MKKIGIIVNLDKDKDLKYTEVLIKNIVKLGGSFKICGSTKGGKHPYYEFVSFEDVIDESEIIVCIGGDGTFLKASREVCKKNKPILGINLGTLGFLTEVDKDDIELATERIMDGNYEIEHRMMLEMFVTRGDKTIVTDVALNDIVVSRGALSRIIHLKTYINNVFIDSFPGDGMLISTPTGSTGYSLSIGGPIVEPNLDLIITAPICPHILYSRSFITTADDVIKVVVDENYDHDAMVTVDGQNGYEIHGGDTIETKKSSLYVKMIKIRPKNFFNVLRTKFYDRGEIRG